jgi:hypothetical protein
MTEQNAESLLEDFPQGPVILIRLEDVASLGTSDVRSGDVQTGEQDETLGKVVRTDESSDIGPVERRLLERAAGLLPNEGEVFPDEEIGPGITTMVVDGIRGYLARRQGRRAATRLRVRAARAVRLDSGPRRPMALTREEALGAGIAAFIGSYSPEEKGRKGRRKGAKGPDPQQLVAGVERFADAIQPRPTTSEAGLTWTARASGMYVPER